MHYENFVKTVSAAVLSLAGMTTVALAQQQSQMTPEQMQQQYQQMLQQYQQMQQQMKLMQQQMQQAQPQANPQTQPQQAAQTKQATAEAKIKELLYNRAVGVHEVKLNPDGSLRSLLVRGIAAIPRGMPSATAEEVAWKLADMSARSALVKYLKDHFLVKTTLNNEVKMVSKGQADGETGPDSSKSSNEITNTMREVMTSDAEDFLSGLRPVASALKDGKKAIIVMAWSQRETQALPSMRKTMQNTFRNGTVEQITPSDNGAAAAKEVKAGKNGAVGNGPRGNVLPVQDSFGVSDDAADFF